MNPLNLDLKYKGQTGAKTTKEYLEMTEKKINEIVGWDIPKEFMNSNKMQQIESGDGDDFTEAGIYYSVVNNSSGVIANYPKKSCSMLLLVFDIMSTIIQIIIPSDSSEIYVRRRLLGNWQSWYKYSGTKVTL